MTLVETLVDTLAKASVCCALLTLMTASRSKAIATAFRENVTLNKDSEQLSENMIDNIITLWNRALSNQAVMTVVLDCETRFGHATPFDSILKMTTIVTKAQNATAIRWVFQSIADLARSGALRGGVTLSMLGQSSAGGTSVSLVNLLAFKLQVRDHLLNNYMEQLDISPHFKAEMRRVFASHMAYREACGYPDPKYAEAVEADLSWQSGFNKAESLFWALCESLVFGSEYDNCLKQAVRLRKPVDAVFDYGLIGEAMADIHSEIETLKGITTGVAPTTDTDETFATSSDAGASSLGSHVSHGGHGGHIDSKEAIKAKWLKFAGVTVRQHVKLVVEPKQGTLMPTVLGESKSLDTATEKGFYILILYDTKTAGENKYRPHIRMPPLREDHLAKLIGGVVQARSDGARGLRQSDLFAILDGGRDIPDKMVNNCFVDPEGKFLMKSKRTIHMSYLEDALQDSRALHRGFLALNQIERMHLITGSALALNERRRIIYAGSNSGNFIGPLAAPDKTCLLTLTQAEKREMYGPMNRVTEGRGGHDVVPEDGDDDVVDESQTAFFHTMTIGFWKEVLHSYCVKSVMHLTGVDGALARACIDQKVPQ